MNKRNMLQSTFSDPDTQGEGFEFIPSYVGDDAPTEEDILAAEKVLKYASQCGYIGFTDEDAKLVMQCSTNILKWGLGYTNFMR